MIRADTMKSSLWLSGIILKQSWHLYVKLPSCCTTTCSNVIPSSVSNIPALPDPVSPKQNLVTFSEPKPLVFLSKQAVSRNVSSNVAAPPETAMLISQQPHMKQSCDIHEVNRLQMHQKNQINLKISEKGCWYCKKQIQNKLFVKTANWEDCKPEWKCRICSEVFHSESSRLKHDLGCQDRKSDSEHKAACRFCAFKSNYHHIREKHELTVHGSDIMSAPNGKLCYLKMKFALKKSAGLVCRCCNKFHGSKLRVKKHEQSMAEAKSKYVHDCQWCNKTFSSKWILQKHSFLHHKHEADYKESAYFKSYMEWYLDPANSSCRWCRKTFKYAHNCAEHEKKFHSTKKDFIRRLSFFDWKLMEDAASPFQKVGSKKATSELSALQTKMKAEAKLKSPASAKTAVYLGSSLLSWSSGMNEFFISYLTRCQTVPLQNVSGNVIMMNFARSMVPGRLLDLGVKNLHVFDGNIEFDADKPGYSNVQFLKERNKVHELSIGSLASSWNHYVTSGLSNPLNEILKESSDVDWTLYNSSTEVSPDVTVVAFLNKQKLQKKLMWELIFSCLSKTRIYAHGPTTLLTFLTSGTYAAIMYPMTTLLSKVAQWSMHMCMDIKLVRTEPKDSFNPPVKSKIKKQISEMLQEDGHNPQDVFVAEFVPKRDDELSFVGSPLSRRDALLLVMFQLLLSRGWSRKNGEHRGAGKFLKPWFPGSAAGLALWEKRINKLTQYEIADLLHGIVLPHVRENVDNPDDAFMQEYQKFLSEETRSKDCQRLQIASNSGRQLYGRARDDSRKFN